MIVRDHPYYHFLEKIRRPSRYVGGEHGQVVKPWEAVEARLCLAFPDLYELGMSHLGLRILYQEVNAAADLLCERVFAPDDDLEQELRARGLPLVSLESWQPLSRFDVVGFSLQYELTYTNLLNMLELGGIPLHREARRDGDPLVVAGGPCALHPEPLAPFIDLFFIGEGEEELPELLRAAARLRRAGLPRAAVLRALAGRPGVYAPSLYTVEPGPRGLEVVAGPGDSGAPPRVRRVLVADLDRHPFPASSPVASTETTFDRLSVEIARGCTQGCRFCQAGMTYRPVRERSVDVVLDTVARALAATGHDEVSLTSLSTADYSALPLLVRRLGDDLRRVRAALSVSSLRAYGLGQDLLQQIARVRTTGLTFAPEAGTQRLRNVINKNVTDADLDAAAAAAFRLGWSKLKLYFMIGLPGETDEDLEGILQTVARVRRLGRELRGRSVEVTASVATFVPRPHTPFQWAGMEAEPELCRKQAWLAGHARGQKLQLKLHERQASRLEGVFARGDRRLAAVLERAFRLGARFDGWDERLQSEVWAQAFAEAGLEPEIYLAAREPGERLPWDHIDPGVSAEFLAREWQRARRELPTLPCLSGREGQTGVCYHCGQGCDLAALLARRAATRAGVDGSPAGGQPGTAAAADRAPGGGAAEPLAPSGAGEPAAAGAAAQAAVDVPGGPGGEPAGPVGQGGRGGTGGRARGSQAPAPAFEQAPALRYRLHYAKLGRAVYLGHLDVVRDLPRILRRAGVTAHYSQGYHPKPAMTFGPALKLGIPSLGEWVDVWIEDELPPTELLARLNATSTEGIVFLRAGRLEPAAPRLSRTITLVEHGLLLDGQAAADLAALAGLDEKSWENKDMGVVRVRRGEREAELPWPELAAGFRLCPAGQVPAELGLPAGPLLCLLLRLRPEGWGARAEELAPLFGLRPEHICGQARLACWGTSPGADLRDPLEGI